ncbi:ADP-ribosylation factor-like protein 2-binding protein isoform X2 [Diaphorina citri]|uniref:ADP-ribosylation factor-like protein 2-binding protein n=1 Tax=Diaphorina citri TaxID=121845 RepID=A0A1S3CVZ6_DIACI|nr:ADP-ribosylation factor-like protein 2-binding protein isoform X2 [Diaphorina citri]
MEDESCDEGFTLSNSELENRFHQIIGSIEDILIDVEFSNLQLHFLEKYWMEFEDVDENKFIYMDIFQEYTQSIEALLENKLAACIPDFDMHQFISDLMSRKEELDGEVFEMLFTLTDFNEFKEMFLDYRARKEGRVQDLSQSIFITSFK